MGASRNRRPRDESVTSTEAQNNFGDVLARVSRGSRVFITRYQRPEAVVLSMAEYEGLVGAEPVNLAALEREFDELFERMQLPGQKAAADNLFEMGSRGIAKGLSGSAVRKRRSTR